MSARIQRRAGSGIALMHNHTPICLHLNKMNNESDVARNELAAHDLLLRASAAAATAPATVPSHNNNTSLINGRNTAHSRRAPGGCGDRVDWLSLVTPSLRLRLLRRRSLEQ